MQDFVHQPLEWGSGAHYTIIIIRNPPNEVIVKAPIVIL